MSRLFRTRIAAQIVIDATSEVFVQGAGRKEIRVQMPDQRG
jgi:hypothetical protein